jgi:phytoene desaturase
MKKVAVIGSGFAGLASAATLASKGCEVEVYEKNEQIGGRARQFSAEGFVFDMGPSWYWMPGVVESFFSRFNRSSNDFYKLVQLSPSFRVYFGKDEVLDIPADFEELCQLFESIEKGSAVSLKKFMKEAAFKYETGINKLVYKPGLSLTEFMDASVLKGLFRLQVFSSFSSHVRKYFKDPRLLALMEFPVLFLGAKPQDTPALYS